MDQVEPSGTRIGRQIDQVRAFLAAGPVASALERLQRVDGVAAFYDTMARRPLKHDGFMNFGYWTPGVDSVAAASRALMDQLLDALPGRTGRILDVACGLGATTRYISSQWRAGASFGVNLTLPQLTRCRELAPGCHFVQGDASGLPFAHGSFDYVVTVEAAHHFRTRERFLTDVFRILKPGGRLALTDLLLHPEGHDWMAEVMPRVNYLPSPDAYAQLLREIGFTDVRIRDITAEGWNSYARFELAHAHELWLTGRCDFSYLVNRCAFVYSGAAAYSYNVLGSATR
jgi:MPBQ/MSBQ methyltransferase